MSSYQSKHWYTTAEFWDLFLNNLVVVGSWIGLSYWLGFGFFFSIYSITITVTAAICICVFFVQHNFEGSYAHKTEGWEYLQGAILGSSYLELPPIFKWFSADIGYHNIHHLSERIPNYYLEACYQRNQHLLKESIKLRMKNIPHCFKFILWDATADRLTSIASFRQQSIVAPQQESPGL